ncbi:Pkinase-domain-containing protein [Phlegmacium glaucopus]|nr:Pkinase-domain-containing protein [Phlegmacium glaucopus]
MDSNSGPSRHNNPSTISSPSSVPNPSLTRPMSVAAHTMAPAPSTASGPSRRQQRASHTVTSPTATSHQSGNPQTRDDDIAPATDVYSHPAAVAYTAAHPRRTIPKFGPYLLLQTLGEGEFGKVKLGLHIRWGEEVAVKLIRRGNVDGTVRMSKVEREIEVLKTLKHPNIVRLYDVIETDKYIGIILEYASGGELFDHILAHRYLRERDAAKLFSQLISGVWYIHQKKIVHRDLKLENLLLDRHRNVIITDFGFANRFEHRPDDLMQTSCGSPCYAAPELVISEGLYVGSAVDIWSCGVILYAMLAGYLPFDDDPANPDGDNINLLYRYIVSTPLSFPDYISTEARDLLGLMLVPDPNRRTTLDGVMRHPWLGAYHSIRTDGQPNAFGKTVEELEKAALDQHQQKRQAYQKQMKANVVANGPISPPRTQSYRPNHEATTPSGSRSRSTQPEYLYDSSLDQSTASSPLVNVNTTPTHNGTARKTYGSPAALGLSEDDPFAGPGNVSINNGAVITDTSSKPSASDEISRGASTLAPNPSSPKGQKTTSGNAGGFRHTIQVEYDEPSSKNTRRSDEKRRERTGSQSQGTNGQQNGVVPPTPPTTTTKERRVSQSSSKPLPPSPIVVPSASNPQPFYRSPTTTKNPTTSSSNNATPTKQTPPKASRTNDPNGTQQLGDSLIVNISSPPPTPRASTQQEKDKDTGSQNSTSSIQKGHKKGKSSIDKLGLSKIFSSGFGQIPNSVIEGSTKSLQGSTTLVPSEGRASATSVLLSPVGTDKETAKKSRRNTLTVMVEPFSRSIRNRKGRMTSTPLTVVPPIPTGVTSPPHPQSAVLPPTNTSLPTGEGAGLPGSQDFGDVNGLQASTSKARKVMQWFRTKSKGRDSVGFSTEEEDVSKEKGIASSQSKYRRGFSASSNTVDQTQVVSGEIGVAPVQVVLTSMPGAQRHVSSSVPQGGHPQRSASSVLEAATTTSLVARFRNSVTVGGGSNPHHTPDKTHPHGQLRIHHGAVDQTTITTRPPPEVMAHVKKVLEGMGVEIQLESEYKYRCIRTKKKKNAVGSSAAAAAAGAGSAGPTTNLAAVTMVGSAASNGIDKRGLPLPSPSAFSGTGGMLRGLLMRRQSSQVSGHGPSSSQPSLPFDDETSVVVNEPLLMQDIAFGDPTQDAGDEVRFSVELTRLDRLNDTFSLDIRRLKGNLRSYKFLYDTLRNRADLAATQA